MTRRRLAHLFLVALGGAACGAGGKDGTPKMQDAGPGSGDAGLARIDGGAIRLDAKADAPPANVFADAPVFNWDVPGAGAGGAGMGGASGSGGVGGMGGSTMDAAPAIDSVVRPDASVRDSPVPPADSSAMDLSPPRDAGREAAVDGGSADLAPPADVGPADVVPPSDLPTACVARLVPVVPAALADDRNLVAGPNLVVALRAEVVSGDWSGGAWRWSGKWNGQPLPQPELANGDSALAAFATKETGIYTFTAVSGGCAASFTRAARGPEGCQACDYGIDVEVVSPPSYGVAPQRGYFPYTQDISLVESHVVEFFVRTASRVIGAYVRINDADGVLVADGYADPSVGFVRPLVVLSSNRDLARYQVLIVPMDGAGDGSLGATAPQLFSNLVVGDLENRAMVELSGGLPVTGTVTVAGQPTNDARIMLSNQDPAAPHQKNLLFSSVGRSNAQGAYMLAAQPGPYWVSFSPPANAGLSEAIALLPIGLAAPATLDFEWTAPATAPLTLSVTDARGGPAERTRVLVSSTRSNPAGTLTVRGGDTVATQVAYGNVQTEASTDARGMVTFPALPADDTYDVVLVPAELSPTAATTHASLQPRAGTTYAVALASEEPILGQLEVGSGQAVDWTKVQVVAFDKSAIVPEPARAVIPSMDGRFSLGVSPGRPYAVVVWPEPSTLLARTFVGPGLLQATPFVIRQRAQTALVWRSDVVLSNSSPRAGITGAALRATCHRDYWRCVDPDIPLAEATTGEGGTFTLNVPDPASR